MAESTVVSCPNCGKKFKIGTDKLGRVFKCTGCETRFKAGDVSEVVLSPAPVAPPPPVPPTPPVFEESYDDNAEAPETESSEAVTYDAETGKPKSSKMAIASFVLGLLGCVPLASFFAVIFGFVGLKKAKAGMGGRGLAITGVILGFLGIIGYGVGGYYGYFAVLKGKKTLIEAACTLNMKVIYASIDSYQKQNDHHYPTDLTAVWKSSPTLQGGNFICLSSKDTPASSPAQLEAGGHCSFKYIYPGVDATTVGAQDVLLYENSGDHNGEEVNVLFGDGHSRFYAPAEAQSLISTTMTKAAKP